MLNISLLLILLLISACSILPEKSITDFDANDEIRLINKPYARLASQNQYFAHEHRQIASRRTSLLDQQVIGRPEALLGVGLSGGGIRSAAYQLGFLAGFSQTNYGDTSLLSRVDYLSSVSGGSWANGAYWITGQSDEDFFGCLDNNAVNWGSVSCQNMLLTSQKPHLLKDTKEKWENDIRTTYLPIECQDYSLNDLQHPCMINTTHKPYPIFNSTHSTFVNPLWKTENLPFEFTPDYLGTIVDCKSKGLLEAVCSSTKSNEERSGIGFTLKTHAQKFEWQRRKRGFLGIFGFNREPGLGLSRVLAHSSAFVPSTKGFAFSMEVSYKVGKELFSIEEVRDKYILSDGGNTGNLGMLALVERGVNVIVLSDMGHTTDPPADLKKSMRKAKLLFDCEFSSLDGEEKDLVRTASYQCDKVSAAKGNASGKILYVKPFTWHTDTILKEFVDYLRANGLSVLAECITDTTKNCYSGEPDNSELEENNRFPQTQTLLTSYDQRLIRSYYLFGRFVSQKYVGDKVRLLF